MVERVYIGLGSNLASPKQQIKQALEKLKRLENCRYVSDSGLFLSRAMLAEGMAPQPDYYNAVVELETSMPPLDLLYVMQVIEESQDRKREIRWGARTIDLDLLLYGQHQIQLPELTVPHPGLCEREFVVYPLYRINPELLIPGRGMLRDIMHTCSEKGMKYVGDIE